MTTEKEAGKIMAENIKLRLQEKNISKAEFARVTGRTRQRISKVLEGLENGSITLKTMCELANGLDIKPEQLFEKLEIEIKLKPKGEWLLIKLKIKSIELGEWKYWNKYK